MRIILIFVLAALPLMGLTPIARIANTTRPGSTEFQVGDRFEIVITGAAKQPVSVRTGRQGRTDWGPVIGSTDWNGRWSVSGQFVAADFGGWREVWTVGGQVANPVLDISVRAPCLPGGHSLMSMSGAYSQVVSCDTAAGPQTFGPSPDPLRTPDGRLFPDGERANMTQEEYQIEVMESMIGSRDGDIAGKIAAAAGDLIIKMIGVNALTEAETRRVLTIVHAAYEPGRFHAPVTAKLGMLTMLQHLAQEAEQESLKQEIAQTIGFVEMQ